MDNQNLSQNQVPNQSQNKSVRERSFFKNYYHTIISAVLAFSYFYSYYLLIYDTSGQYDEGLGAIYIFSFFMIILGVISIIGLIVSFFSKPANVIWWVFMALPLIIGLIVVPISLFTLLGKFKEFLLGLY